MRSQNSRLRKYLWDSVQVKFSKRDLYDKKILGEEELRKLLSELLDEHSDFTIGNLSRSVFKVDPSIGKSEISLVEFTQRYIEYCGEVGLRTFNSLKKQNENILLIEDFYNIFISSFRSLDSMRVREVFLNQLYSNIDANRDGQISPDEYIMWIKDFVSNPHPLQNQRKRYYLKEDDLAVPVVGEEPIIQEVKVNKVVSEQGHLKPRLVQKLSYKRTMRNLPNFSNYRLADQIIAHTVNLLSRYDLNRNNNFEINEIEAALKDLLKEDDEELFYAIVNDFRYNLERIEIVSYESIAKFFLACHCGEMTIKRMHIKKLFSQGEARKMNEAEFLLAFGTALEIIKFSISEKDLRELFYEVDLDHDGWVTYSEFFEFLRYFFKKKNTRISITIGTSTIMEFASEGAIGDSMQTRRRAKTQHGVKRELNRDWKSLIEIPEGKLEANMGLLIRRQIHAIILKLDKNGTFEQDQDALSYLMFEIFDKTTNEIQYAMRNVLRFNKNLDDVLTYDELTRYIIQIQFGELALEAFKNKKNIFGSNFKMSLEDFISIMRENCYYIGLDPSTEDLEQLFKNIDKDNDGFITALEFYRFVKLFLAGNVDIDDLIIRVFDFSITKFQEKEQKKAKMKKELAKMIPLRRGQSKQVKEVVTQLYTDLKAIFDKYDFNNDEELDDQELEALLRGLLKENSQQELDYIFWNMFRIDKKGKGSVQFEDFAPFILKHSAEITLQRFHAQQKSGKNTIDLEEFKFLMNGAFHFISAIKKDNLHVIFGELDKDGDKLVQYKEFLGWILTDIAPRVR